MTRRRGTFVYSSLVIDDPADLVLAAGNQPITMTWQGFALRATPRLRRGDTVVATGTSLANNAPKTRTFTVLIADASAGIDWHFDLYDPVTGRVLATSPNFALSVTDNAIDAVSRTGSAAVPFPTGTLPGDTIIAISTNYSSPLTVPSVTTPALTGVSQIANFTGGGTNFAPTIIVWVGTAPSPVPTELTFGAAIGPHTQKALVNVKNRTGWLATDGQSTFGPTASFTPGLTTTPGAAFLAVGSTWNLSAGDRFATDPAGLTRLVNDTASVYATLVVWEGDTAAAPIGEVAVPDLALGASDQWSTLLLIEDGAEPVAPPAADWVGFDITDDPGVPVPTGSGIYRYVVASGGASSGTGSTLGTAITLTRAWQIAQPGDVIRLQDGNYGQFWGGGSIAHSNGPSGALNGTAVNPITFVGETAPSFDRDDITAGARFVGTTSNSTNPLYLGNCSWLRWWRFTCSAGQSALVLGNETGKTPMGPANNCDFRYMHILRGNQELVTIKHNSASNVFDNCLLEISNNTHVDLGQNWVANGWGPEPRSAEAISEGLISPLFLGEAVYFGYNSSAEMTTGAHAQWPATTGPGNLTMRRITFRDIEGGEVIDMKSQGFGTCLIEDSLVDGCSSIFDGVFNNARGGRLMTLRNLVVRGVTRHWSTDYDQPVVRALSGPVVIENMIAFDVAAIPLQVSSGSINGKHITLFDCPGITSGPNTTYAGCVEIDVTGTATGFYAATASQVVGPTATTADAGEGIGSGLRPSGSAPWRVGAAASPATDLVGATRPASCAYGALEPA